MLSSIAAAANATAPTTNNPPAALLPFAAAMVLLAARIWQAAVRPASHTLPPAVVVTAPAPAHPQS